MDTDQDLKLIKLYAPVEKIPLSKLLNNDPPKGKEYVILDTKSKAMLSFCSKEYKLRKNSSIYKAFEKLLDKNKIKFKRKITIVGNTKFYVSYIIIDRIKSLSITDMLPKICIWNSYDGTIKTQIRFGYYKILCGNTLSRPGECSLTTGSKHNDLEFTKDNMPYFFSLLKKFLKEIPKDMKVFEKLYKIPVLEKNINSVISKINLSLEAKKVSIEHFKKEIKGEYTYKNELGDTISHEGSEQNMFTLYNSINYSIYNTNLKELPDKKQYRDFKLVSLLLSI